MRFEELKNQKGPETDGQVELSSVSSRLGRTTVELHHISKAYGAKKLIDDFTYLFLRNDRELVLSGRTEAASQPC